MKVTCTVRQQINIALRGVFLSRAGDQSADFAMRAGMSAQQWSRVTRGIDSCSPEMAARIEAALLLPAAALEWAPLCLVKWCLVESHEALGA